VFNRNLYKTSFLLLFVAVLDYFPAFGQQEPLMFFFWKHQNFYLPSETGGENSFDELIRVKRGKIWIKKIKLVIHC